MTTVKISGLEFDAVVQTRPNDSAWGNRESKAITVTTTYEEVKRLFTDDVSWSILVSQNTIDGNVELIEKDMSDYSIAGSITDNRDGTITVKMGKHKDNELMRFSLGSNPQSYAEASALRNVIEMASSFLDDKTASSVASLFPHLRYNGALVSAGTRINWNNIVKKAAVDLWDTIENNPENAPALWQDLEYKDGYRIIPDVITVTTAFTKDELGWYDGLLYRSLIDSNVYTPSVYPGGWEAV